MVTTEEKLLYVWLSQVKISKAAKVLTSQGLAPESDDVLQNVEAKTSGRKH